MKIDIRRMIIILCISTGFWGTLGAAPAEEVRFLVDFVPGGHYSHLKWFGIIPVTLRPQIALWIESAEGRFMDTIYSTKSNGENTWKGADQRPEALPFYNKRRGMVDAWSSATFKKEQSVQKERSVTLAAGDYVVYAEINNSFDYNESYPESHGNVDGQPALIYQGRFTLSDKGESVEVILIPAASKGLTTALSIMESITVKIVRE